jgi:hypothetical protein
MKKDIKELHLLLDKKSSTADLNRLSQSIEELKGRSLKLDSELELTR